MDLRHLMDEYIPFNKFLGIRMAEYRSGYTRFTLDIKEDYIGDPLRRAIHGGVISTLIDVAGGAAVWSSLPDPLWGRVSTIDLRVDYLRPGKIEPVVAEATVVRQGNRVGVTDIRVFHAAEPDVTIATGKGVYNIKKVARPET